MGFFFNGVYCSLNTIRKAGHQWPSVVNTPRVESKNIKILTLPSAPWESAGACSNTHLSSILISSRTSGQDCSDCVATTEHLAYAGAARAA